MRGPDHSAQIVGIFYSIQHYQEATSRCRIIQVRVIGRCTEGNHSLVGDSASRPVELFPVLEADRNVTAAAQLN
jgi:hypothetical protein